VVIAGGGYGLARLLHGAATPASGAAGGGRISSNLPAARQHGASPNAGTLHSAQAGSAAVLPLTRSGTDYQPGQLAAQVEQVLSRHPVSAAAPGDFRQLQRSGLDGCVSSLTGGAWPRLVDQARYQGRPATIIVTAGAGGRPGQVWVVGTGCSATSRHVIAYAQLTSAG
jgi:hypothetical protein